jgi:hypothetical protein
MPYKDKEKQREYYKIYQQTHKDSVYKRNKKYKDKNRELVRQKENDRKLRQKLLFIEMYGGKCLCCGEIRPEFLTVDHIKGQKRTKRETKPFVKAIKEYSPNVYRILCFNCNQAIGYYGYCPHQQNVNLSIIKDRFHLKHRLEFISLYGGKCFLCGEDRFPFLSLDHVKGQIGKKKESCSSAYKRAITKVNIDEFRILCHNCNQVISHFNKEIINA